MKTILVSALLVSHIFFNKKDKLTGRWESKPSEKGNVTGVVFKTDKSFEGYVNKKPFVSGNYTLENDVFTFTDNGCDGKPGTYQLIFFSYEDSVRFAPISDSCTQRKEGMSRLVMGRVK